MPTVVAALIGHYHSYNAKNTAVHAGNVDFLIIPLLFKVTQQKAILNKEWLKITSGFTEYYSN